VSVYAGADSAAARVATMRAFTQPGSPSFAMLDFRVWYRVGVRWPPLGVTLATAPMLSWALGPLQGFTRALPIAAASSVLLP